MKNVPAGEPPRRSQSGGCPDVFRVEGVKMGKQKKNLGDASF
jgi:hypothetical protein